MSPEDGGRKDPNSTLPSSPPPAVSPLRRRHSLSLPPPTSLGSKPWQPPGERPPRTPPIGEWGSRSGGGGQGCCSLVGLAGQCLETPYCECESLGCSRPTTHQHGVSPEPLPHGTGRSWGTPPPTGSWHFSGHPWPQPKPQSSSLLQEPRGWALWKPTCWAVAHHKAWNSCKSRTEKAGFLAGTRLPCPAHTGKTMRPPSGGSLPPTAPRLRAAPARPPGDPPPVLKPVARHDLEPPTVGGTWSASGGHHPDSKTKEGTHQRAGPGSSSSTCQQLPGRNTQGL